jgi:hypothetical protein
LKSRENLKVLKIPSLSLRDFRREYSIAERNFQVSLGVILFWPVALVFGFLFDQVFRVLASANSSGKYSWVLTSTPLIFLCRVLNPDSIVFATGGASGASVSAVLAGLSSKRQPILEFQDPFIGNQMVMSEFTKRVMVGVEAFLVRNSGKVIFVTRQAATDARARNVGFQEKIQTIYPGSKDFGVSIPKSCEEPVTSRVVELLHLGTLYGSRNLNNFFQALDQLYLRREELIGRIMVTNVGAIYGEFGESYALRKDFTCVDSLPRLQALERAEKADVLLLVQHTDSRSNETIPYKTYDYLNLSKRIFGLVNSPELGEFLIDSGAHVADSLSVEMISVGIEAIYDSELQRSPLNKNAKPIILIQQLSEALGISL